MKEIFTSKNEVILVDDEDYINLSKKAWQVNLNGYAMSHTWKNNKGTAIYMHRMVCPTPKGFYTDHINGNKLDNRKENLRAVTPVQSQTNTRRLNRNKLGVVGAKKDNWDWYSAAIRVFGKKRHIGIFKTPEEAAQKYNAYKAIKNYAKFNCVKGCCCD
jgi:HNH endonuclease